MRSKIVIRCIEKLKEAEFGRNRINNINYVLEALTLEREKNKFRGIILKDWLAKSKEKKEKK